MIEKIMKAVKSGNKKRGRNITVGAVVGMLLSCTVAMGTDATGLEITNDGSKIEFTDKDGTKFEPGTKKDPYPENTWDEVTETYTNNTILSGIGDDSSRGYGISLSGDLGEFKFRNNALIKGIATDNYGAGIYIDGSDTTITELINNGSIKGTSVKSDSLVIWNEGTITTLTNNGSMTGISTKGESYGIYNEYGTITTLTNNGAIKGASTEKSGYGIDNVEGTITTLINNGSITGISTEGISYGIYSDGTITTLTNIGVVYGGTNAIYNFNSIDNAYNYGLLVSGDSTENVVDGVKIVDSFTGAPKKNEIKNYGLAFIVDSTNNRYIGVGSDSSSTVDYHNSFGTKKTDGEYIIINAKNNGTDEDIKTESMELKNGALSYGVSETEVISSDKQYILNGIENTLKVSGTENELNNSVINAYKTAVVMDKGMSTLTLDNTVVNGGVAEDSPTVNITGDGSTLTVKGDSVINTGDEGTAITITGDKMLLL